MPKIFLSYKFTGVPLKELETYLKYVTDALNCSGTNEIICNFDHLDHYEKNDMNVRQIMDHACVDLLLDAGPYDYHILLVSHTGFSEGATFEYGFGYGVSIQNKRLGIPDIIAKRLIVTHESIKSVSCLSMSDEHIVYSTTDDLCQKIKEKFK